MSSIHKASVALAAALVMCLLPLPYGFYMIIRVATSIIMAIWAVRFLSVERISFATISGGLVLLFQPIIKIPLDRLTWNIVDVILAIFLLVLVFKIDDTNRQSNESIK